MGEVVVGCRDDLLADIVVWRSALPTSGIQDFF